MDEALITIAETPRSARSRTPTFRDFVSTPRNAIKNAIVFLEERKRRLRVRSNSAPPVISDELESPGDSDDSDDYDPNKSRSNIVKLAFLGLFVYVITGLAVFILNYENFNGTKTIAPIDALYFTVVTLCTIGYGDIVPNTTFTKLFTCIFILVGFGFIYILLSELVMYVLDRQEEVSLDSMDENRFKFMRMRTKVCLALGVVVFCIGFGTVCVHFIEEESWVDSFYLSVTSVTTVGYGYYSFKTLQGRCFAIVWILVSTLMVARALVYITELRIDRRNRQMTKWVLQKKMNLGDLVAADWDNDGSISKYEYVVYKLKEMRKITEKDVVEICKHFDSLEKNYGGKITFADLLNGETESD